MFLWKRINERCVEESCNEYVISGSENKVISGDKNRGRPPNIREIGRASWLYLHSMANRYPENPDDIIKKERLCIVDVRFSQQDKQRLRIE
ncbi:Erv1 / Alr family protein [Cryptosporidium ryanae]|uniref:Erv1 / Alr family protein n=1 Tax=Cryptosporidium ryanae TaxID=515981 RepID=UPI00351A44F6|nr:Erv1 / Alr family protein [Cryptosporidium ryanae]